MKPLVFFISLFIWSHIAFAQFPSSPIIINFERDFKGKPDKNSPFVALTVLTWEYSYQTEIRRDHLTITFQHEYKIEKGLSWVKLERLKDPALKARVLHHEQGHVNISFIMVKEADRVLSSRTYSKKDYRSEIGMLASSISEFFDTMQKNYDDETEHGSNYKMQQRWDKIIQEKMEEVTGEKV
ncbi:hypothetical protein ABIB40_001797 [Pedobacter sp. UYP30]|uniref:DUF922 domain-containing protein n=1 Tax=Pedobacter sp. UYP30 TaxID=1756400 RepID=UPI0033946D67